MAYRLDTMASGDLNLSISQDISWEDFLGTAKSFLREVDGTLVHRTDTSFERVWEVMIRGQKFWLSWDDNGGMSLDSTCTACNEVVKSIYNDLLSNY